MAQGTRKQPAARSPRVNGSDRRRRVLEAALAAITERGVADVRMKDIAERSGMSPGHILYYFRSKADILLEVLQWNEDRFHEELRGALKRERTPRQRLLRAIKASVPSGAGDPHWLLWLEVWAMAPHDRQLLENQELQGRRFQDVLEVIVSEETGSCRYPWCAISCPSSAMARTASGWRSAVNPGTKNVARTPCRRSAPRSRRRPTVAPYAWCVITESRSRASGASNNTELSASTSNVNTAPAR